MHDLLSIRCLAPCLVATVGFGFFATPPIVAQDKSLPPAQQRAIDAICAKWDNDDSPGISVAVIRDGKLLFAKGYGQAHLEHKAPITPSTVFHTASVTKQFTAFALVLLAQEGKLSLDDNVRKHVPWLHDFGQTIRIRHLLNHTSGLRDQWELLAISGYSLEDVLGQDHILRILRHQRELNFAPGKRFLYSNMGFTLAAHIVELVSGQPFPEFCRRRIFEPLQMKQTHMHRDHQQIVPGRAYSYKRRGSGWRKSVLSYANAGATSLFTTAPDLVRWLANFGDSKVGGKAAIETLSQRGVLTSGKTIDYALGIRWGSDGGHAILEHGGADAGFRSNVVWYPDQALGIAVLGNAANAVPGRISRRIAKVLLKGTNGSKSAIGTSSTKKTRAAAKADSEPAVVKVDPAIFARYVGRPSLWSYPPASFPNGIRPCTAAAWHKPKAVNSSYSSACKTPRLRSRPYTRP